MKYLLALLAVVTVFSVLAPSTASADPYCQQRIVRYLPCGRPVYANYQVCGYDNYGRPVGHWVTQEAYCGCQICQPRPDYSHHHHCEEDRRPRIGVGFGGFPPRPPLPPLPGRGLSFFFGR